MYYSTICACGNKYDLVAGRLVVYKTPSNYAIGIIMPNYYWNFRGCLRQARGLSLQQ